MRSTHRRKARLLGAADVDFVLYIVLLAFAGVRREELHKGLAWESIKLRARHDPGFCWNRENRAQAKDLLGSERFGLACALSREARPDLQSRSAQAHGESVRCVPCEIAAQRAPAQLRQLPPGANERRRASRARDGQFRRNRDEALRRACRCEGSARGTGRSNRFGRLTGRSSRLLKHARGHRNSRSADFTAAKNCFHQGAKLSIHGEGEFTLTGEQRGCCKRVPSHAHCVF